MVEKRPKEKPRPRDEVPRPSARSTLREAGAESAATERTPASDALGSAPTLHHPEGVASASGDERVDVDDSGLVLPGPGDAATLTSGNSPHSAVTVPVRLEGDSAERPHVGSIEFPERYAFRRVLGEGGMGEVRLCRDNTIGREVAMKVMHPHAGGSGPASEQRFVREARVQGQLEHPSIVPVYDLGVDPDGAFYFTMKRVRGHSLETILSGLGHGDEELARRYTRRKLLSTFSSVCLAVDFTHSRGVLHRDLKPANVMLGDFGEVYVLDWGLAKIHGARDLPREDAVSDDLGQPSGTLVGEVMGTPGYMSPEQIRGQNDQMDERSDVYSLGAILYELLTLQRMHVGNTLPAILESTTGGSTPPPCERAPEREIPPELEQICLRATAVEPGERFASVRELSDAIERYLDGDRDLELRREMAARHAETAEHALVESSEPSSDEVAARGRAMREVTTALGLDPNNTGALRTLVQLLTRPPREMPPEAAAELQRSAQEAMRVAARTAIWVYFGFALYLPFPFWMGIRSWQALLVLGLIIAACAGFAIQAALRPPANGYVPLPHLLAATAAVAASATMLGPFVIVPTLAMANNMAFVGSSGRKRRLLVIGLGCLGVLVPTLLQWTGVLPDPYSFHNGVMSILPVMFQLPRVPTLAFLLISSLALVLTGSVFTVQQRDAFLDAERRLQLQAWQLRQIVPAEARDLVQQ